MMITEANMARRPTWAEIDLDALAENLRVIRARVGSEVRVMAAVKADAYGHGAVPCAKRLEAEGVDWFGVALPEEGIELRRAGISKPILCLGGFRAGQENAWLQQILTPVVYPSSLVPERFVPPEPRAWSPMFTLKSILGWVGWECAVTTFQNSVKRFHGCGIFGLMA